MTCTACGDKPKNTAKDFTKAVIEIDNPESLVLLRKVVIPASMGDDTTNPPVVGKYKNVVMVYEATDNIYLYSSDGIPTKLTANLDEIRIRVEDLEEYAEEETAARTSADEDLQDQIDEIRAASDVVDIVGTYAELEDYDTSKLTTDDIIRVLVDETKDDATTYYRWTGEEWEYIGGLGPFYTKDETDSLLDGEADAREAADANLQDAIDAEASARQDADDSLSSSLSNEEAARQAADATLQDNIDAEASARATADEGLSADIVEEANIRSQNDARIDQEWQDEATARGNADQNLQTQINGKQNTLTAGTNITINNDTISAVDTTYSAGTGLDLTGTAFSVDTSEIQEKLTAGTNISIASDGKTISATDTTYSAGSGLDLTGTTFSVDTTTIQPKLTAGANISISSNTISATDTTYSAGTGLDLTGTTFSADTTVLATQTDLSDEATARSNADTALSERVTTIEGEIPSAASSSNQLADKSFVNSSISTNTANYISDNGQPFTSVADLEAYSGTVTNNDYAFVTGTDGSGNAYYDRYKATVSGSTVTWAKEYRMNNSTFTSGQWAAINSGITTNGVTKLNGLAEIKSIGSNLALDANGKLSATDTTYSVMTGAGSSTAGASGLVPAPAAGDNTKYLAGDGTWKTVSIYSLPIASASTLGGIKVGSNLTIDASTGVLSADAQPAKLYSSTGQNTDGAMTQKATTDALSGKADSSSLATVATSGSYSDLSNKPTIPTVNNATLTIQKNGTSVGTFTANASSDTTANITVPTALSDLTNDINAVSDSNYVHTDNNFTTTEKNKLAGIASGAEVNQNAFSNVKVGSTTVAADSKTDTLELVAGDNITLTPDATNDKVTVTGKQQTRTNDNLSPSEDTVAAWSNLFNTPSSTGVDHTKGPFFTYYNTQNCFTHQPSQYGFLETFVTGGNSNIIQRWTKLVDGETFMRSGNQGGWFRANTSGGWERFSYGNQSTYYATSSTAADTAAKVATLQSSGVNGSFKLEIGARVSVKFTNANTYNGTATLNVDGTGAKSIAYIGSDFATRYTWRAGEVVDFIYDGTNWVEINGGVADTTYYGVTKLVNSVASTSTSMAATPNSVKQAYDLASSKPDITMTDTDPGEGSALAENNYIGVYDDSAELVFIGDVLSSPTDMATMITRKVLYTSSAYSTVVSSITLSESVASYDALEITFNQRANVAGRQSIIPSEMFGAFLLSLVRADGDSVGMFGAYCSASGTTLRLEAGGGVAFSSQSTPSGYTNDLETVITKVVGIKYS